MSSCSIESIDSLRLTYYATNQTIVKIQTIHTTSETIRWSIFSSQTLHMHPCSAEETSSHMRSRWVGNEGNCRLWCWWDPTLSTVHKWSPPLVLRAMRSATYTRLSAVSLWQNKYRVFRKSGCNSSRTETWGGFPTSVGRWEEVRRNGFERDPCTHIHDDQNQYLTPKAYVELDEHNSKHIRNLRSVVSIQLA